MVGNIQPNQEENDMKLKQIMVAVAAVAMTVVMTGCGGSPKGVAEKFADAIIQRETDTAVKYYDTVKMSISEIKKLKEAFENRGKEINDNKLTARAIFEKITVLPEDSGYVLINGAKYTGEDATVTVQFVKGNDKKAEGLKIRLTKIDGSWKVNDVSGEKGLDTSDK